MRKDAIGFFWNDAPIPKPPKPEAEKRVPPARTWELPGYLPGLEAAQRFNVPYFTDHELMSEIGGKLIFDIECYTNYFQIAFISKKTGRVIDFVMTPDYAPDWQRLFWITQNFTLVGFNSWNYDIPMLTFALAGHTNETLKQVSDANIKYEENFSDILKAWKLKRLKCDHIDLIEVAPLFASLKIYGGRVHCPRMQDLPFPEQTVLSHEQMQIVRWYCVNDLVTTCFLDETLTEQLALRDTLTMEHGIDLRSKSDAQIAEAVIGKQITQLTGRRPVRPEIDVGTVYRYNVPAYMTFHTQALRDTLDVVRNTMFIVDHTGSIGMPPELAGRQIQINRGVYTMGIGGLHSTEKKTAHRAVGGYRILEIDVESFYPRIILNQGLFPLHLGEAFLQVFNQIVERRIAAKHAGNKVIADSLKITINGSYGKLGSQWSILYAPDLLIQVTLSGQLSLLMLIELLEAYGIEVISANTDGIAMKCKDEQVETARAVVKHWEQITRFKTEENEYVGLYSKDVNNYIAVKKDGKTKTKGLYFNPWNDKKNPAERLKKNPSAQIAVEAAEAFITKQVPIEHTIRSCLDVTKFISVRSVKGGAVKNGEFLGKSVRWYYAQGETGEMVYAKTGNKVPLSDGARPLMDLPNDLPADIDYDWYVQRAERILNDVGYYG